MIRIIIEIDDPKAEVEFKNGNKSLLDTLNEEKEFIAVQTKSAESKPKTELDTSLKNLRKAGAKVIKEFSKPGTKVKPGKRAKPDLPKRTCENCLKDYKPTGVRQRFCSRKCKIEYNQIMQEVANVPLKNNNVAKEVEQIAKEHSDKSLETTGIKSSAQQANDEKEAIRKMKDETPVLKRCKECGNSYDLKFGLKDFCTESCSDKFDMKNIKNH